MNAFVWDPNFITGLPTVDEQHHTLVDLPNALSDWLFHGASTGAAGLQAIFERLLAYAAWHFKDEKALVAREGLDGRHIQAHRRTHQQFVEQVRSMWSLRCALREPSKTIMDFLTAWLGLHILGIDQSMARQIAARRAGTSAEQAYERERRHNDNSTQALLKMVTSSWKTGWPSAPGPWLKSTPSFSAPTSGSRPTPAPMDSWAFTTGRISTSGCRRSSPGRGASSSRLPC